MIYFTDNQVALINTRLATKEKEKLASVSCLGNEHMVSNFVLTDDTVKVLIKIIQLENCKKQCDYSFAFAEFGKKENLVPAEVKKIIDSLLITNIISLNKNGIGFLFSYQSNVQRLGTINGKKLFLPLSLEQTTDLYIGFFGKRTLPPLDEYVKTVNSINKMLEFF